MQTSKTARTPMSTMCKLSKDEAGEAVDLTFYKVMIGSLLYLTASIPDLCYSVGVCARYQTYPHLSHLVAAKCIIKYIKGIIDHGLYYMKQTNPNLVGLCDADWIGNLEDRCSTTRRCFIVHNSCG